MESIPTKEETDAAIPEEVITWVLAPLSGLLVGGFLFFRLHHLEDAYEWAVVLGGFGLAGIFPGRRLAATLSMAFGMAAAASIGESLELLRQPPNVNTLGPLPVLAWFFLGLAGSLFGGAIVHFKSKRTPRLVHLGLLAGAMAIGAFLPWRAR